MTKLNENPNATAREEILTRIRAALTGAEEASAPATIPRDYRRHGSLNREACLDLFIDRLVDYDAAIVQIEDENGLPSAVASALQKSGEQRVIIAAAFPREWLPTSLQLLVDNAASTDDIDSAEAVITTCEVAVASSGTIILKHVGAQGRRVITLLPDHHICLVRRAQVVELLPEAIAVLNPTAPAPITTIAGPSATSDIEMTRIRGVHGPRRLTIILYGDATR